MDARRLKSNGYEMRRYRKRRRRGFHEIPCIPTNQQNTTAFQPIREPNEEPEPHHAPICLSSSRGVHENGFHHQQRQMDRIHVDTSVQSAAKVTNSVAAFEQAADGSEIEEGAVWKDAVADLTASLSADSDGHSSEEGHERAEESQISNVDNSKLSKEELQILLRGKTVEALSLVLGSRGRSVVDYSELREMFNEYARQLRQPLYPCYTTLLNSSMRILKSCVFANQSSVVAEIDTSRAGVQLKYKEQERRGEVPKVTLPVIAPSEWGKLDVVLYDYMQTKQSARIERPTIMDLELAAFMLPEIRSSSPTTVYELYPDEFGFQTGRPFREHSNVVLTIPLDDVHLQSVLSGDSRVIHTSVGRRVEGVIHCVIGTTYFVQENQPNNDLFLCDAVTTLLVDGGHHWRNALLVHRFSPQAGTRSAILRIDGRDGSGLSCRWSSLRSADSSPDDFPNGHQCSFGTLADGRRFAIMRILLYTDDFQPYGFRQGSAGGCYILPLGVPVWERSGVNSIRILGVTPAGVTSNVLINAIIPDIAKASSEGVSVAMPDGSALVLFLDVVGYIGDYPAMVHLLDVNGVHGLAPCNYCTFHKARASSSEETGPVPIESSSYAYSTAIHSGNLSFRRTRERMLLWSSKAGPAELQRRRFKRTL